MKSPPDRAMAYTVAVIIAAVVLFVVIGVVSSIFIVPQAAITQSQEEPPALKALEQLGKNLETFTKGLERAGQAGARESGEGIRRTKNAIGAAKSQCWSISAVSFKPKDEIVDRDDLRDYNRLNPVWTALSRSPGILRRIPLVVVMRTMRGGKNLEVVDGQRHHAELFLDQTAQHIGMLSGKEVTASSIHIGKEGGII